MAKDPEYQRFYSYFPQKISKEIVDYIDNVALLASRYIFTYRQGHQQFGYCTHCNKEFETNGLRHGQEAECPKCGSRCVVKASGRSRKYLIDDAYIVFYQKSPKDKQAITARGIFVKRDYRSDFRKVETQFCEWVEYLFKSGYSSMYEMYSNGDAFKHKTVYSFFGAMQHRRCFCPDDWIEKAVSGTPFQYSTWEKYYSCEDMVKFFDLAAKYPCIEYLTKLGLNSAVNAKMYGYPTYRAINWRGKSITAVLNVSKQQVRTIIDHAENIDLFALRIFQISLKDGSNLTYEESEDISNVYDSQQDLSFVSKRTTVKRAHAYLLKQVKKEQQKTFDIRSIHRLLREMLYEWRDYLKMCQELKLNLDDEYVYFPPHLKNQHDNTLKQVKMVRNKLAEEKIVRRMKILNQKYYFQFSGLFVRPAKSGQELIQEGEKLHHCVGTYADAYAKGKTAILLIRRENEPDNPYFTVEVKKECITQCYGLRDCRPNDEIKQFLAAFKSAKLEKKSRIRVEVAG